MAVRRIFVSGDGNDQSSGADWGTRVKTFTRAREIASGVASTDQVRFMIGQFHLVDGGVGFGQRLGKGFTDGRGNVPDGWVMEAVDPALPWHFTDLTVLNLADDFVQVYKDGTGYNAAIPAYGSVRANGGVPSGVATGIWVTTKVVATAGRYERVARVWRGGQALTIGDRNAVSSAYDPYNEIWEARDFSTLGQDGTHGWTQLRPGEIWPNDPVPTQQPPPQGGRLFVFSPKDNPRTVWGGVTLLVQKLTWVNGVGDLGFLSIERSSGWHVDPSVRAIGGGRGSFMIRGGCTNGLFEARIDVMSPFYPAVALDIPLNWPSNEITQLYVSPRWDMRVTDKPYYEFDDVHSTGRSDTLQITNDATVRDLTIQGRTSTGELCFIRDPGHAAIGRPNPAAGAVLERLVVERDFSVYIGGMQYQRAFGISGDKTNVRDCTISGRVYGQRTPSQIGGSIRAIGLEFHYGQQIIPAAPDNVQPYPSRFNNDGRDWANLHPNGKNRDAYGLVVTVNGLQEIRDCVFNATHGPGLALVASSTPDGTTQRCTVTNCTFINSGAPGSQQTAVLVDARHRAGSAIHLVDNVAVGYAATGGAGRITTNGYTRRPTRLEDLGQPYDPADPNSGAGVATNTGWRRQEFAICWA